MASVPGECAGVLDLAFHRDGIKRFTDGVGLAHQLDVVLATHFIGDHARRDEETAAGLAECLHQRAVIELADNPWLDLLFGEPAQQPAANHGFLAGNQQRRALQALRELLGITLRQCRGGEKTHPTFTQLLAVALDVEVGRHRAVGDHQVQALDRQVRQQTFELVLAAGDADRLVQFHGRSDQPVDDGLGHHIRDPDPKQQGLLPGLRLQHRLQFVAQLEHLFGVGQGLASGFSQFQLAPDLAEQLDAQTLFQQADLAADGLWCEVQLVTGAHDAAGLGHDPEIVQLAVIEHSLITSLKTKYNAKKYEFS